MSNLARNAAWTFIVQIVLLLCSADRIAQAQEMSAKDVFNKWHSAVVTIQTDAKSGTGFLDSYGFLHTAYHVLDGCSSATAIFSDGRQEPIVAVNSASKERDVAIVTTAYSHSPGPQLGDYSATVPGERVVVIGSPLGLSQTVTEGIVSAKRNENGVDMLQLSLVFLQEAVAVRPLIQKVR